MPTTAVAVLVMLVAISPGYLHHRVLSRTTLRDPNRSAPVELVEFFSAGALWSAVSASLVLMLAEVLPAFVPLSGWLDGGTYLKSHPWQVLASASTMLVLSVSLCAASGAMLGRISSVGRVGNGSAWARALSLTFRGLKPYLAVELADGRLVEGRIWIVEDAEQRMLALQGPLAISGPGSAPRTRSKDDFVIIPESAIRVVHGKYETMKKAATSDRRG